MGKHFFDKNVFGRIWNYLFTQRKLMLQLLCFTKKNFDEKRKFDEKKFPHKLLYKGEVIEADFRKQLFSDYS